MRPALPVAVSQDVGVSQPTSFSPAYTAAIGSRADFGKTYTPIRGLRCPSRAFGGIAGVNPPEAEELRNGAKYAEIRAENHIGD